MSTDDEAPFLNISPFTITTIINCTFNAKMHAQINSTCNQQKNSRLLRKTSRSSCLRADEQKYNKCFLFQLEGTLAEPIFNST